MARLRRREARTPASGSLLPLTWRDKSLFAIGTTAESVAFGVATFLLIYYNQVLGLNPGQVGTALSLGLFANAIFDPIVGSWSDRTRSRFGRRHIFMFSSIIPVGLSAWAAFNPPSSLGSTGLLIWLAVSNIVLQQALTIFHTPHLAFGGELSSDYIERSSIMNYNTFCMWLGDTVSAVMAYRVFFRPAPGMPNGALDGARYPLFSIVNALVICGILLVSSLGTIRLIPRTRQPDTSVQRMSFRSFWGDMKRAVSNYNYAILLVSLLFFSLMTGVRNGLILYIHTYYWGLDSNQISWFVAGSMIGYVIAGIVVGPLHRRMDKRSTAAVAGIFYAFAPAVPLLLGLMGVLTPDTPGLLLILISFAVFMYAPYSLITTTARSLLADIADENELKHGIRQEGVLYSARTFFQRIDSALGTALAGWVLAWVAFPAKAVPGHVDAGTLDGLALAYMAASIPGFFAALCYAFLRVSRDSYDRTRAALNERAAAQAEASAG